MFSFLIAAGGSVLVVLVTGIWLVARYRTAQRLAGGGLRESRERLRLALDAAHMGTWDSNLLTGELVWSESVEPLFGLAPGAFEGTREAFYACVHPEDRERVREAVTLAAEEKVDLDVEHRILWPDGSVRWLENKGRVFRDESGKSVHLLGTVMDITPRKEAEEALRESRERLRLALDAAHMGTWDSNQLTGELAWSESVEPLFGLEPGVFEGTREAFYACVHPEDRERVREAVTRAVEDKVDFDVEYRILWPDGSVRWLENKGRLFRDESGNSVHLLGTVMDITARKEAERMQRVEQELRLAAEIQKGFLPAGAPRVRGMELGGRLHPSGQIGGDFYDFLSLPDERVGVAVGDASGKGIPGALLIGKAQGVLRSEAENVDQISDVIVRLNRVLCRDNATAKFVTLFYAVLDAGHGSVIYVNAGHSPALLFRESQVLPLASSGPALGMFPGASYRQHQVSLSAGDLLVIYSDGVSEALGGQEAFFGERGIREAVSRHRELPAAELAGAICEASEQFELGNRQAPDDKTVVVIRAEREA